MASFRKRAAIIAHIAAVTFFLGQGLAIAADGKNVAEPNTKAFEKIIRDYLLKNPEIVREALEAHQRNLAAKEEEAVLLTIQARGKDLRHDPGSVVGGNPSGDVTIVEFFDYRCGVCKRVHPIVDQVVKRDGKVRRVYKEWPILGPQSVFASRAAIASRKQGDDKYLNFHNRMMTARQALTGSAVMKLATSSGLDAAQLKRDMNDPEIDTILRRNYSLAQALNLNGTPSFLIGDTLLKGGRDADTMLSIVRASRKKSG